MMTDRWGIDVSQQTLAGAVASQDGSVQSLPVVANTPEGWQQMQQAVQAGVPANAALVVVFEPTGGYDVPVALWLHAHGLDLIRPNPRAVHDWRRSQGRRAKTDEQDAQALARYGLQPHLPRWQPLAHETGELEQWHHWRDEMAEQVMHAATRDRQIQHHPYTPQSMREASRRAIQRLREEVTQAEEAITQFLRAHPQMHELVQRLQTVPCIGARSAVPVLLIVERYAHLSHGQGTRKGVVALAGVDPRPQQSGTSVQRQAHISG